MARNPLKIWYDTEFIEDGRTIDLISIGMVDENGRELYLISSEFDEDKASDWVKDNVLVHIPPSDVVQRYSKREIRASILEFVGRRVPEWWAYYGAYDHVVLCQLFGAMVDLPGNWPHFTRDIKQYASMLRTNRLPRQGRGTHDALEDARWNKRAFEYLRERERSMKAE